MRILDLSVYGVHPARSAGHSAILDPLRRMAVLGHEIEILSLGLRSFERRLPRRFRQEIAPGLGETRLVSAMGLVKAQLLGRKRFPPIEASVTFADLAQPRDLALLAQAEIVILESPWAFGFAKSASKAPILWIAHNQEAQLHDQALAQAGMLERARELEGLCFREADLVLALHDADAEGLQTSYGPRRGPLEILPLGCEIQARTEPARRLAAKKELGLDAEARVALFAGSAHGPNVRAADELEAHGPDFAAAGWQILIAGSVRSAKRRFPEGLATGPLADLASCYEAADLAVNPVVEGGGMNVKNLHALARGLPVLCSHVGARGFPSREQFGILEVEIYTLASLLGDLGANPDRMESLAKAAHQTAKEQFSWPAIVDRRISFIERHLGLPVNPGRG